MTINQSKVIGGENYIVVNYTADSQIKRIWILWQARDSFFSPIRKNSNSRTLNTATAGSNIELIFPATESPKPIDALRSRGIRSNKPGRPTIGRRRVHTVVARTIRPDRGGVS